MTVSRVLPEEPVLTLDAHEARGGGRAIGAARRLGPDAVIEDVLASGLRGRGGAGFPTARKWSAVRERATPVLASTVVANGAEGEPGSFKDRTLLRTNPFAVLEGALVAALAVDADRVVVAIRRSCTHELTVVERAMVAMHDAGWSGDIALELFTAPEEYLVGEETGLLEVLDGRPPFPRVQPPYRHGVDEVFVGDTDDPAMATLGGVTDAPPTLVNNVETLAHVAGIVAEGPGWFRSLGTVDSPGTIVCTVSGDTARAGVGEFPMGTPVRDILDELGDGVSDGRQVAGVLSGVAHPLLPGDRLDTPASHEALQAAGSGLGAAGFIVFDDQTDLTAVAAGVSHFLAVESCGQCTPCKQDGRRIAEVLGSLTGDDGANRDDRNSTDLVLLELDTRLRDITDGARCALAQQHQDVVGSILALAATQLREHTRGIRPEVEPIRIAAIDDIVDGHAVLDAREADKQPDWTFEAVDSGEAPADRYGAGRPSAYPPGVTAGR